MFAPVSVSRHIAPMIEGKSKTMHPEGGPKGKAAVLESDHLELLADMGEDFASSLDIEKTIAKALNRIIAHLDAEGGALFLLDDAGETLRCHASVGKTEITGLTLKSDEGIVGRSVQSNTGEIVRDADIRESRRRNGPGVGSVRGHTVVPQQVRTGATGKQGKHPNQSNTLTHENPS